MASQLESIPVVAFLGFLAIKYFIGKRRSIKKLNEAFNSPDTLRLSVNDKLGVSQKEIVAPDKKWMEVQHFGQTIKPPIIKPYKETILNITPILKLLLLLLVVFGLGFAGYKTFFNSDNSQSKEIAWRAIRSHLNSPSTASIAATTSWELKNYKAKVFMFDFDGQNGFGGTVRNQAIVLVYKSKKDGDWHFEDDVAIVPTFNGIEETMSTSLFARYKDTIFQESVEK